ncbi:hypothetical protein ACPRNU_25425 [Chromobacterium vaccinii]|uniref:hypothetical protein n=1 Tax=Chromobacterium vaccinii TaxID=1108595 RepID=UPI003C722B57
MNQYPYEILIRLSAAGIAGASVRFAADQPNPLSQQLQTYISDPQSLSVADGQAGLKLADVLGQAAAVALSQNQALQLQLADVQNRLAALPEGAK